MSPSDWFSLEIRKDDFPKVFEKLDRPSLVISTLEALAILVALKLRFGEAPDADDKRVVVVLSVADNRGIGAALNQLVSTRFPSSAVLMELATCTKEEGNADDSCMGAPGIQQRSRPACKRVLRLI